MVHYLDDFVTCGKANTDKCAANMAKIIKVFEDLGVLLAMDKLIGPVAIITYLGIEIDSINIVIRLPTDKFSELLSLLSEWYDRKKMHKKGTAIFNR